MLDANLGSLLYGDVSLMLLFRSLLVIISCHTNAVAESCGDEAATFVDKYWQFQMHYCYNATTSTSLSTQVGTTTQLHLLDSITQETTTSQESIMQGTTTTQESITQGTATSQESITQGQATSQEGITQGPATSQEDTTQGTATSQEGITQGPATSQEGITQGSVTSQEGITQGAATSQESFNGSAGVRQFIALLILFLHCSLKNI